MRVKKEFVVHENPGFRLKVVANECIAPKGLISLDFVQESLNKQGKVDTSSIYNFNMTRDEIKELCDGLMQI
jgi:hypothetical protein